MALVGGSKGILLGDQHEQMPGAGLQRTGVKERRGQADESPGSHWGLQHIEGPLACEVSVYLQLSINRLASTKHVGT